MAVILKRVAALARNRASPEAIFVRWYNPLHLAQKKPHDLRAEGRRQAAAGGAKPSPQPPSGDATDGAAGAAGRPAPRQNALTQAATASAVARHAAGEALTLAELIRMQEAGHSPALPSAFLAHASTVRTYQGSSAKVRADSREPKPASNHDHWPSWADDAGAAGAPVAGAARGPAAEAAATIASALGSGRRRQSEQHGAQQRAQASRSPSASAAAASATARLIQFDLRPRELVALLDKYVVKQAEAKKVLAVAVCDHYNHARACLLADAAAADGVAPAGADGRRAPSPRELEHTKPNVLLLGSTGVGKTYLMRTLARLIGVPFVRADATKFTATGYVGRDPEDLLRDLLPAAGGDLALAQHGIIYVDEIDKLCTPSAPANGAGPGGGGGGGGGGNIHTRDVQNNFLKLLEDTDVPLEAGAHSQQAGGRRGRQPMAGHGGGAAGAAGGGAPPSTLSTKHVLFIFSGAFSHVPALANPVLAAKAQQPAAGVAGADGRRGEAAAGGAAAWAVETASLVGAGLEPELVGRLPVRVRCEPLDEGALIEILARSKGSALRQMEREMAGYGVQLTMTDCAMRAVARAAAAEGTGARGLVTILEGVLRPFKYELPSTDLRALQIDAAAVADPHGALAAILADFEPRRAAVLAADVARHAARAATAAGLRARVELADCARDALVREALGGEGRCAREVCDERLEAVLGKAAAAEAAAAAAGVVTEGEVAALRVTAAMLAAENAASPA